MTLSDFRVRFVLASCLVAAGLVLGGSRAWAQCAFDGPTGSKSLSTKLSIPLVQHFAACGTANTVGLYQKPACSPPDATGAPAVNHWRFGPSGSWIRLDMKRVAAGPNLSSYGFPQTAKELGLKLELRNIVLTDGVTPASGIGKLLMVVTATIDDYSGSDMTLKPIAIAIDVPMTGGNAKISAKIGDPLIPIDEPRFPDCANLEIESIQLRDPTGLSFAAPGARL